MKKIEAEADTTWNNCFSTIVYGLLFLYMFTIYDLNWVHDDTTLMKIRQYSSVHVGEILLVPSPHEGGGHQGEETLILDRSNEKKKRQISEKKKN